MLNFKRMLDARMTPGENAKLVALSTPWTDQVDPNDPLPEHPRPQMLRKTWMSLNGQWECTFVDAHIRNDELPKQLLSQIPPTNDSVDADSDGAWQPITVPFSPEATLSGVERQLKPGNLLWYRRTFSAPPEAADGACYLRFEAVDYACAVWFNGKLLGTHAGGYTPFSFEIADLLRKDGTNEIMLCVADPSETGTQLRGKQRLARGSIFYTAQSGIWQSVWMEWAPANHIQSLYLLPDVRGKELAVGAFAHGKGTVSVELYDINPQDWANAEKPEPIAQGMAEVDAEGICAVHVPIADIHLWSPNDPHLYTTVTHFCEDEVLGYCGFRTTEVRAEEDGTKRFFLNDEPLFLRGVLDQGYWPDGLMTPPTDDALRFDLQAARDLGFNMVRKHVKLESPRWYYHADCMGMIVWQDMVSGGDTWNDWQISYKPSLMRSSWDSMHDTSKSSQKKLLASDPRYREEWTEALKTAIRILDGHPCIATWVLFNEGWGQFDARKALETVRKLDPTRPVDAVSGWYDQRCGDYKSVHNYFRDLAVWHDKDKARAFVISEFGGLSLALEGHTMLKDAYGYDKFEDRAAWAKSVQATLAEADALETQGLAGFVYTQLTDIEDEVNGLLTYDRRVNKMAD